MLKQIDISQYVIVEKLSNDNNKDFFFNLPHTTFLSRESSNNENLVVIKEFPSISSSQFSSLARSVESINVISHPCLANVIGFYQGSSRIPPSLVYTFYPFRSVKDLIKSFKSSNRNNKYQFFNGTHFMKICFGVAYALNLMHTHNPPFIHRDLRAGTVLLTTNYEPFISGFGISEINSDRDYIAPEVIVNKKTNAFLDPSSLPPIDVYAYGILVENLLKVFIYSANIVNRDDLESLNCFRSLIERCKNSNPMSRPKFSDILFTLDNKRFTESLKNIQSSHFDNRNYSSYHSLLVSTPPGSGVSFQNGNNRSDIDLVFGPLVQVNPFLNQDIEEPIMLRHKNKSLISELYSNDSISTQSISKYQSKPEIGQLSISSKNLSKMYPAQIASQLLNSQPRSSTRSLKTQSFREEFAYQNPNLTQQQMMQVPRAQIIPPPSQMNSYTILPPNHPRTPITQSNFQPPPSYSYSNQTQDQPASIEAVNSYGLPDKFNTENKHILLLSDDDDENDNNNKSTNDYNDFDNFLKNQNEPKAKNKDSSDYNEFDNFLKSENNNNNTSTSHQLNNSTFPSIDTNENKTVGAPGSTGTRFLGGSFLFGGNGNSKSRSVEEVYEDAIHNDKGDTVYLNIIRATKLFKEAADRGHTDSMYMLGMKLYKGLGIRIDVGEAVKYFLKAWKEGRKIESLSQLAEIYVTNKKYRNLSEADKYIKEALKMNDLYANFLVVKLFVENDKYDHFYCSNNDKDIEVAEREAEVSLRFCLKKEYKVFSKEFIDFAKLAPKSFFDSLENDSKTDPSVMFYLGMLHHQAVIDNSSASRAVSLLENSFLKNYRPAFDYFVDNNLNPSSYSSSKSCYDIIKGSKIAKSGREAESMSYLRNGSETCPWGPDYAAIHSIIDAMKNGRVDTKPVINLLTRFADNGSGAAKEELGMVLVQGIKTEKSVNKGLYYLKSAFDDDNYEMKNYQFLHISCPGFYCQPS